MSFNNGQVPGHIHWEVGAGTLAGIATAEFDERNWDAPAPKQPPRVIGGDRCAGYLIAIYRFPENDGQLEGHDVALATAAGDHATSPRCTATPTTTPTSRCCWRSCSQPGVIT